MREIKFRVWTETNKYDYDNFVLFPQGAVKWPESGWDISFDFDKEAIVEQYTGLKDKNGKEIYEGDILKGMHEPISFEETIQTECEGHGCYITKKYLGYKFSEYYCPLDKIEVIGNIHENPELLNA